MGATRRTYCANSSPLSRLFDCCPDPRKERLPDFPCGDRHRTILALPCLLPRFRNRITTKTLFSPRNSGRSPDYQSNFVVRDGIDIRWPERLILPKYPSFSGIHRDRLGSSLETERG